MTNWTDYKADITALSKDELTFIDNKATIIARSIQPQNPSLTFVGVDKEPIMKLENNGDIYVKGKLIENDLEVVEGMKAVISGADSYWKKKYEELNRKINTKPRKFRLTVTRYFGHDLMFFYDTKAELTVAEMMIMKGVTGASGRKVEQWIDEDDIRFNGEARYMGVEL